MINEEVLKNMEEWAPPGIAWDKDNIGLQVGSGQDKIRGIFLCLELNKQALDSALKNNCNLIITHHPLIFNPITKLDTQKDSKAKLIKELLVNNISVFSFHTNLDFTKDGVSFALADKLKLKDAEFLEFSKNNQFKLVVFVPEKYSEKVSNAMFKAGGGNIGDYSNCSFRQQGSGTFMGSENSNPVIGAKLKFEKVNEIRIEMLVDSWNLHQVIKSMNNAHPYEEAAYDIYPVENINKNYGFGVIGTLSKSLYKEEFLKFVCSSLGINNLRFCNGKSKKIKKVAVCGGSGSNLVNSAIRKNADAFITADIKYHTFQDAEESILLIDAGHYETEIHSLPVVKSRLEKYISSQGETCKIFIYKKTTNPVKNYNNRGV